jgi:predicted metal-dependent peptidase
MMRPPFEERYEFVGTFLQRRRAYLAAAVIRLGRVQFTRHIETATIVASGPEVLLYFNPDFCDRIDNLELAGVLVHEALHFALRHQERASGLRTHGDRFLFNLACDAVINDWIQTSFQELRLPGCAITGQWLIGENASGLSAEEVFRRLRKRIVVLGKSFERELAGCETVDDHSLWDPDNDVRPPTAAGWTAESEELVRRLVGEYGSRDAIFGSRPLGMERPAPPACRCRKNLGRFLVDTVCSESRVETRWTQVSRKLAAVYPHIILPTYELTPFWNVLIAIDTSGSVPDSFVAVARKFASERIPRTKVRLISFDTTWYEAHPGAATLRGGGGTRAHAVEDYIRARLPFYPHYVFVLSDGFTPPPRPRRPERWIWILPPWGSAGAIPKASRREFFEPADVSFHR